MRWLIIALIVALIAGVTAATLALRSSAPPPGRTTRVRDAQGLVKAIDAKALAQGSVHWTDAGSVDDYSAQEKWRSTSDVTTNSGVQRITISRFRSPMAEHLRPTGRAGLPAKGDAARVEIRLVGDALYLKGNVAALEWMALDLSHAQAMRYAGRWISLPKWRDPLGRVAEDLTLAQMVDLLDPARDFGSDFLAWRRSPAPDGTQVLSFDDFDETMDGYTLTTLTGSKPLPVALDGSGINDGDCRGGEACPYAFSHHFSRWNEPVHVIAPKHAVPIATVRGK